MSEENWETLISDAKELPFVSMQYYPRHANFDIEYSNVAEEIENFLQRMVKKTEFSQEDSEDRNGTLILYQVIQLSSDQKHLRFVTGKENSSQARKVHVYCSLNKEDAWEKDKVGCTDTVRWVIDTELIAAKLNSDRVVFLDSKGKPSKKPYFKVSEEDEKLIVIGSIKGIRMDDFREAFPSKNKKM